MTLGGIAGLIAAVAFVALVGMVAVPLWKLGRVLEELRRTVRTSARSRCRSSPSCRRRCGPPTSEIGRISQVTEEVATLSKNAAAVSENAAQVSSLVTHAVGTPIIKVRSLAHGSKPASPVAAPDGRRASAPRTPQLEQGKG